MADPLLPALLGGTPVRAGGVPAWPRPDPEVMAAVADALATGAWGQYHGEHVSALERELADFHDVPYALACASGTLAVEAALRALRVGPGDEVVMAAYDYDANFLTVHAVGAKPVLVDVDPANWNLDPAGLAAAVSARTKAFLCSHLHGGLVPMRDVMEIAHAHDVGVVEDAAQAAGAVVQGKPAGTWGDVGVLSFGGTKLLTAGRGGAMLCSEPQLHQRAKVWLQRGLQQWAALSELQAAVLRPQLRRLRQDTQTRWECVQALLGSSALSTVAGFAVFNWTPQGGSVGDSLPAFYRLGFRYDTVVYGLARDLFVKALRRGRRFQHRLRSIAPRTIALAVPGRRCADPCERCPFRLRRPAPSRPQRGRGRGLPGRGSRRKSLPCRASGTVE